MMGRIYSIDPVKRKPAHCHPYFCLSTDLSCMVLSYKTWYYVNVRILHPKNAKITSTLLNQYKLKRKLQLIQRLVAKKIKAKKRGERVGEGT